jgi:hypothetical protein
LDSQVINFDSQSQEGKCDNFNLKTQQNKGVRIANLPASNKSQLAGESNLF